MLDPAVIQALVASGVSAEQLAAAVLADQKTSHEKLLERRAKGRQRQRQYIEKMQQNQQSTDTNSASVTVSDIISPPPSFSPLSPLDKENTPTPLKEINSPLNPPYPSPTPILRRFTNFGCFDQFWQAYPNRVGKKDASKSFDRAVKRAPFDKIMAGLQKYVAKTDDRPWCNPATWLNQDRWEDQPASVQLTAKPLSPQMQVILNNRRLFSEAARAEAERNAELARASETPELLTLGRSTSEIIPANRDSGYTGIYLRHDDVDGGVF